MRVILIHAGDPSSDAPGALLGRVPGLEVIAYARGSLYGFALIRALQPDLVVVDVDACDLHRPDAAYLEWHPVEVPHLLLVGAPENAGRWIGLFRVESCRRLDARRDPAGFLAAVAELAAPESPPAVGRDDGRLAGGSVPCVLVVDDEPAIRQIAIRALRGGGYSVITAESGAAALSLLAETRRRGGEIAAVLTDVCMPGMSGAELARRLHAAEPEVPLILMSGSSDADLRRFGVPRDERLLRKPFAIPELLDAVDAVVTAPVGA